MSQRAATDVQMTLGKWADEVGTTDDPRKHDDYEHEGHLSVVKPADTPSDLDVDVDDDKERERWCRRCKCRVTIALDGTKEYGHARTCEHAITREGSQ